MCLLKLACDAWFKLLALVVDLQLELPTLKGHQHTPELVPGDFPAIDNNEWHATILSLIPFDSGSHHFIGNLQSVLTILDVRDRQGATHPIYEPP